MYSFKLNSNEIVIKFINFNVKYGGLCSGKIQIQFKTLDFTFIADMSPSEIKKINLINPIEIIGWGWQLNLEKTYDNLYYLTITYSSNKNPINPNDNIDLNINKVPINTEDFNNFIDEYNYFSQWVGLTIKKIT